MRAKLARVMVFALGLMFLFGEVHALGESGPSEGSVAEGGSPKDQLNSIKLALTTALKKKDAAQKNNDVIQINCVNDSLGDLRGQLLVAKNAYRALQDAKAESRVDKEQIDHQMELIRIASMRAAAFKLAVEGCVGEDAKYTGETVTKVEIDQDIRTDNPAIESGEEGFTPVDFDRPEAVSGSE